MFSTSWYLEELRCECLGLSNLHCLIGHLLSQLPVDQSACWDSAMYTSVLHFLPHILASQRGRRIGNCIVAL